jgi:hypothetical protein
MKLTTSLFLILITSLGLTVASGKTESNQRVSIPQGHSRAVGSDSTINLRDFGALGDGTTNDGPALQSALDALAESGGGTLFVPAGRYPILTPVQKDFSGLASSITIAGVESLTPAPPPNSSGLELTHGLDLVSEFAPRTGAPSIAIKITGLQTFLIEHITFIGTPAVSTDALITLALYDIAQATIRHCEFYGLSSVVDNGAIVLGVRSDLRLEQSVFLGCAGNSAERTPVVQNLEWKGITVNDTVFTDYGRRPELFGKLSLGTPSAWVNIGNAAASQSISPRRQAVIKTVFFDEGGFFGLSSLHTSLPTSAPIDLVYVSGLYMNVTNLNASGNYLFDVERVLIENSHYGWSHHADSAINLLSVGNAILDKVECAADADRIRADSETGALTVIDSTYNHLDSLAHTTRVITTTAPDEDPVQYVRQRFITMLGREPDAAAHFFWSDRQLNCGENLSCIADQRAALNAYLNTAPSADFSVSGRLTNGAGAALPGVIVTLSGSQSVTTQTDADGRYLFGDLPTSGVYAVTPKLAGYMFDRPAQIITTPNGNQTADFMGMPPRFEFSEPSYSVVEGTTTISVRVTRTGGDTSSAAEVIYSAVDGSADQRGDVIPVMGRLSFEPGETSNSFLIFITDDSHVEGTEGLTLELSDPVRGLLGSAPLVIFDNDSGQSAPNPIDDAEFFVRQQYRDFLNRPPDTEGLAFWSNQILSCGSDAACIADQRINVSGAFFLSIEFQETGFLVYRLYQASFAQVPEHLNEFLLDTRTIGDGVVVNTPGWQALLETNKIEFIESFVERPQFTDAYPANLTPAEFVDLLNEKTGGALSPADVAAAVAEFQGAATSESITARGRALRRIAENANFSQHELNPAFVLMQYFGYLQRNPNETPDTNLDGYNFWLHKLEEFGGDFRRAEMVKSFLVSGEYRQRFGTP